MTDAELQGFAAQALNMARHDIEQGEFNFLLASCHVGDVPPMHRMRKIEALIVERLGKEWLNHSRTKDHGFHVLRLCVKLHPPDAIVFVTGANLFKATAKLTALPVQEQRKALDCGHDRHHHMVKEGLLEIQDCLIAVVQTPQRVCNYVQEFQHGQPSGKPETKCFAQATFDGRVKMYP